MVNSSGMHVNIIVTPFEIKNLILFYVFIRWFRKQQPAKSQQTFYGVTVPFWAMNKY